VVYVARLVLPDDALDLVHVVAGKAVRPVPARYVEPKRASLSFDAPELLLPLVRLDEPDAAHILELPEHSEIYSLIHGHCGDLPGHVRRLRERRDARRQIARLPSETLAKR
jgi:hypothetical protein